VAELPARTTPNSTAFAVVTAPGLNVTSAASMGPTIGAIGFVEKRAGKQPRKLTFHCEFRFKEEHGPNSFIRLVKNIVTSNPLFRGTRVWSPRYREIHG
jgi:hypothetical protein